MIIIRIGEYLKRFGRENINSLVFNGIVWPQKNIANVPYVLHLKYKLFSAGVAVDKDLKLETDKRFCEFVRQGETLAVGEHTSKLFEMKLVETPKHHN